MAWTTYQIVLVVSMVVTGSINTLSTKWADEMYAANADGKERQFTHPFFQAACMFLGEMLCIVAFKIAFYIYKARQNGSENEHSLTKGNRDFNPFYLCPPALFDMMGTSVMYVGLNLTYASSFQMLRGSAIVFVGIMSMIFLQRKLNLREWIGIVFVIAGLAVVGVSDILFPSTSVDAKPTSDIIIGDCLIIGAQILSASQFVFEEKYVTRQNIPALQAVGWEGIFGFITMSLLLIPFYYIIVPDPFGSPYSHRLEDVPDAFLQMKNNNLIIIGIVGTILSIALFNFCGISVTKEMSSTTRMVLDSVRTLVIWIFSISIGWQQFHWLQIVGFILLVIGTCLYNNILIMQGLTKLYAWMTSCRTSEERASIIEDEE